MAKKPKKPEDCVWIPIDVPTREGAESLRDVLMEAGAQNFKVGLELATAIGAPAAIALFKSHGANVWYDGKFCDIPNTVAGASKAVVEHGADMFNVHAWSGSKSIQEAAKHKANSLLLAVTVLTSNGLADLKQMGLEGEPFDMSGEDFFQGANASEVMVGRIVKKMTLMSLNAGADGVVCSPKELNILADTSYITLPSNFMKVTPGVRPLWADANDQKRVMTPAEAMKAGATALVIGRPITNPPTEIGTCAEAFKRVCDEIASAL